MDDKERAELEEYRFGDRVGHVIGLILATLILLLFGSCSVAAYKADAFEFRPGIGFGVDLTQTYCYVSGKCPVRRTPQQAPPPVKPSPGHDRWEHDHRSLPEPKKASRT